MGKDRLTKKLDEPIETKYLHFEYKIIGDYDIDNGNYGRITNDMIYNKLGRLEDIEEELDVDIANDLSKVLLASKNGFYSKEETTNIHTKEKVCQIIHNYYAYCYCDEDGCWWVQTIDKGYPVWQYGKTWALTIEELKNDK